MKRSFKRIRSYLRFLIPRVWLIDGVEKHSGERLCLIWIGPDQQKEYILGRIFGQRNCVKKLLGRRPIVLLGYLQWKLKCPLAVVAAPRPVLKWIGRENDVSVPWWIDSEMDIEAGNRMFKTRSAKDDCRRIRKNELSFEIANTADQYKMFYERIYLPTIVARHGGAAVISSFDERMSELSSGKIEILLIKLRGKTIGGSLLDYRQPVPALRDLGFLDADKELLKKGVVAAAYIFGFQYFRSLGHTRVCLGLTRCFLDDGVLTYKQKWLPMLTQPSSEAFLYRVLGLNDASRSVLHSSSCITYRNGRLGFTFFAASKEDDRTNRTARDKLASIYGINATDHIDISGDHLCARGAS